METTTMEMTEVMTLVERYFAMWNATDPVTRHELVGQVWSGDANYLDPRAVASGPAEIEAMVSAVRAAAPAIAFRRTGDVDAHNGFFTYPWEMSGPDGAVMISGVSFAEVADGRLSRLVGFFSQPVTSAASS